ncbi:MAG: efflux RND transporter periplasmic adaptor subunit [Fimbriimonadaceae bacterium]|nr:efflux RND transporter periplasmic adaptor subunit [Fimbriimonadaceae bacterium]
MNYPCRYALLLLAALSSAPTALRAQPPADHADHPAVAADGHAEHSEPAAHHEEADHDSAHQAAANGGRPGWRWPLAGALLLLAAAAPPLAARRARPTVGRWVSGLALLATGGVLWLAPPPVDPAEPAAADEHAGEAAAESPFVEVDPAAVAALGLRTALVAPADLVTTLAATGRLLALESHQAHLGSRVPGRLTSDTVRVGERVAAGQVVATLDSVDAAQAAAAWREAGAQLAAAQRNLAVRRRLVASGALTQGPLEEARRQLAAARTEQAKAGSALAQARNELDAARAEQERTTHLAGRGAFTTAAEEEARQRFAETEQALAAARTAVAEAAAEIGDAEGEVALARQKLASASALAERTGRLVATGELDRAPLEQAQNALAAARSQQQQSAAALDQAERSAQRGEELYRAELLALNDLEARRAALRERQAQHQEATAAVATAQTALRRQEQISHAQMAGGRAQQEADNSVAEARRELAAAEARLAKRQARQEVVSAALTPAQAAVNAARGAMQREQALAGDGTRAQSASAAARLRVQQAERTVDGTQGEASEAARQVALATTAVAREQRLAREQVRGRELLLDAEQQVQAAGIAQRNAAEMLQILGASTGAAARGASRLQIPIRTPLAGLVTALEASVGEAVGAEQDLLTVVDLSELYVEADVPERDLPQVAEGQLVRVTVRAFPAETFLGSVVSLSGQLDPETRAAHVRARLQNPAWRLRPEMFAEVGFVTAQSGRVLHVPAEAVQEVEGRAVVFVQLTPLRYETRPVTLGPRSAQRVAVTAGLHAGENVVIAGSYLLKSERLKGELGHGHAH